jgi:hypothetical protein
VVNTIQCGNLAGTETIWREIARKGEGRYFRVQQDGGAVVVATPFDDRLAELAEKLEDTRVYYGKAEERRQALEADAMMDEKLEEAPATARADRAKFFGKDAGSKALGRGRDLVTRLAEDEVKLEDVKEEELPEELQKMTPGERKAHFAELLKQRAELKKQIGEISRQRDEFLRKEAEERAKEGGKKGFDALVMEAAREQAAERGIEYKEEK